jgi:hypothetical protein
MERSFVQLKNYPTHLVSTSEPWVIKRKRDGKIVSQFRHNAGYYAVNLNGKLHLLHRIIGEQYLENPDNLREIDHISRDKTDNRLENLRWISHGINQRNKTSYKKVRFEYFDSLPTGFERFNEYVMRNGTKRKFENLFIRISDGVPEFITFNSESQYRYLYPENIKGNKFVLYYDINRKQCAVMFSRISKTQTQLAQTQPAERQTGKGPLGQPQARPRSIESEYSTYPAGASLSKTQDGINITQQQINETQQGINLTQQNISTIQQEMIRVFKQIDRYLLERKQGYRTEGIGAERQAEETSDEEYEEYSDERYNRHVSDDEDYHK